MAANIYQYVLSQLQKNKGSWSAIAIATKIPKRTLEKVARQEIKNPSWSVIDRLNTYLRGK